MFHRILVPLDGSRRAEMATPAAARLARASHGTVMLMRSIVPLTPYGPYVTSPSGPPAVQGSQERDAVLMYLQEVAQSEALAGVHTSIYVTEGSAADSILTMSQSEKADLIAVCAHGATGYHRWKLGGVTQHVVRHAVAPVLLLPDPSPGSAPDAIVDQLAGVRRILVPLDGSMLAETAIPLAVEMLSALAPETGELHLLQVISPFTAKSLGVEEQSLVQQAEKYLTQHAHEFQSTPTEQLRLKITTEVALDADAAERVVTVAEPEREPSDEHVAQGYDMVVMATHGRTGVMRWTLGSIAERIIQTTRRPMLIVRPVAQASE